MLQVPWKKNGLSVLYELTKKSNSSCCVPRSGGIKSQPVWSWPGSTAIRGYKEEEVLLLVSSTTITFLFFRGHAVGFLSPFQVKPKLILLSLSGKARAQSSVYTSWPNSSTTEKVMRRMRRQYILCLQPLKYHFSLKIMKSCFESNLTKQS